jgi:uncharacterized membrane protein
MSLSVICLIASEIEAERTVIELRDAGFSGNRISVLLPDRRTDKDMGIEKHSKAPEGTATGAGAGALLGGTLGLIAGLGAIVIPGVGPFIAAGPLMAALSGAAIGTSLGGITGGLIGLGIQEYEAKQYESKVKSGKVLLSVHIDNTEMAKRAEEIFKANGAEDIKRTTDEKVHS